jgi:Flp pilus assembly protein TadD
MARKEDTAWEIGFFETVLKRSPRDTAVLGILGNLYTKTGRVADGLRMDRRLVRLLPEDALAHYNLACSLALSKRPTDALRHLQSAVDLGYDDPHWMAEDPDLHSLHAHPRFKKLLAALNAPK